MTKEILPLTDTELVTLWDAVVTRELGWEEKVHRAFQELCQIRAGLIDGKLAPPEVAIESIIAVTSNSVRESIRKSISYCYLWGSHQYKIGYEEARSWVKKEKVK